MHPWLLVLVCVALGACPAHSQAYFVYPPPDHPVSGDYGSNIIMTEGHFVDLQFANVSNPNNTRINILMGQLNAAGETLGWENIIQNAAPDTVSQGWIVNTATNITASPMFYMAIFFDGAPYDLAKSHAFNISASAATMTTTSSSSTSTSSSSSTSPASVTTPAGTAPSTPPPASTPSSGLSTGAKAGIAAGIVGAALLGLLVGWLVLGHRRKRQSQAAAPAGAQPPMHETYYAPLKVEPPPQYPLEVDAAPGLYELPPGR